MILLLFDCCERVDNELVESGQLDFFAAAGGREAERDGSMRLRRRGPPARWRFRRRQWGLDRYWSAREDQGLDHWDRGGRQDRGWRRGEVGEGRRRSRKVGHWDWLWEGPACRHRPLVAPTVGASWVSLTVHQDRNIRGMITCNNITPSSKLIYYIGKKGFRVGK